MNRVLFSLVILFTAIRLEAVTMARVTAVVDGSTVVVDGNHTLHLAGVDVVDDRAASDYLRSTLMSRWVMVESDGDAVYLYRSPDALFINRELIARGIAVLSVDKPITRANELLAAEREARGVGAIPRGEHDVSYLGARWQDPRQQKAEVTLPPVPRATVIASAAPTHRTHHRHQSGAR